MRPLQILRKPAPWMGAVLVLMASLALVACDTDITVPDWPDWESVWVTATLNASREGPTEARLLYDGGHIGGNHDSCGSAGGGCGELRVTGFTTRTPGRHTIEIQVMQQATAEVTWQVAAEVRYQAGGPVQFHLGPVSRTLREGDSVTFEVDIP